MTPIVEATASRARSARPWPSTGSISRSSEARCSASSVPTAPARRRRSACWTAELPVTLAVLEAAVLLLGFGTREFRRHTGGRIA
jgi:hypothetical protein